MSECSIEKNQLLGWKSGHQSIGRARERESGRKFTQDDWPGRVGFIVVIVVVLDDDDDDEDDDDDDGD